MGGSPMLFAFLVALFVICAVVMVALPIGLSLQSYFRNRGRRTVICPENHQPVTVEARQQLRLLHRVAWAGA